MKANKKFKELKVDEGALMFNMLVGAGLAVILLFAILNIGTYINGTISSQLVESYPSNTASGSMDSIYWHNATTTNTTRNVTLTCTASQLNSATTRFYIHANGSAIAYNLTVNGNPTNRTSHLASGVGYNHTLASLITSTNVSNSDRFLNFTWNVSANKNRIYIRVFGTYFVSSDYRTALENNTVSTLENVTAGYDRTVEIIVVAAIITAITIPLAAIVAVKKLF